MNVHSVAQDLPTAAPRNGATPETSKREDILRAALTAFAERGLHGVAVPEIAAVAGVGVGTIYRYFSSKEILVNELFRECKGRLWLRLTEAIHIDHTPKAVFDAFWGRLVRFATEEPLRFRFLEMQDHLPYLDARSRDVERSVLAPLWARFADYQKRGALRRDLRPEVMMAIIWGMFVGLFKAERNGYFSLAASDIVAVRDAGWRAIAAEPLPIAAQTPRSPNRAPKNPRPGKKLRT